MIANIVSVSLWGFLALALMSLETNWSYILWLRDWALFGVFLAAPIHFWIALRMWRIGAWLYHLPGLPKRIYCRRALQKTYRLHAHKEPINPYDLPNFTKIK